MTKAELLKMIEHIDDNAELLFVEETVDKEYNSKDCTAYVYKVLDKKKAKYVRTGYWTGRYEEKGE